MAYFIVTDYTKYFIMFVSCLLVILEYIYTCSDFIYIHVVILYTCVTTLGALFRGDGVADDRPVGFFTGFWWEETLAPAASSPVMLRLSFPVQTYAPEDRPVLVGLFSFCRQCMLLCIVSLSLTLNAVFLTLSVLRTAYIRSDGTHPF